MVKANYVLCQCSICCEKEVLDKETNQIVPGIWLKRGEWQAHQMEDQGLRPRAKRHAQPELALSSGNVGQLSSTESMQESEPLKSRETVEDLVVAG